MPSQNHTSLEVDAQIAALLSRLRIFETWTGSPPPRDLSDRLADADADERMSIVAEALATLIASDNDERATGDEKS